RARGRREAGHGRDDDREPVEDAEAIARKKNDARHRERRRGAEDAHRDPEATLSAEESREEPEERNETRGESEHRDLRERGADWVRRAGERGWALEIAEIVSPEVVTGRRR